MIDILILGYSNIVQKRVIPALNKIKLCNSIEIVSKSSLPVKKDKVVKCYSDYIDALNRFNGNLVYVSLPNSMHDRFIIESLERNLSCIVDKPAILREETIDQINKLAHKKKCIVAEASVFTKHKAWNELIKNLNGPDNIFHADCHFMIPQLPENNFRLNSNLGGGAHTDMAAYSINVGRYLWNAAPKDLFISNLIFDNDLIKSFCLSVDYGQNRTLNGFYGFGFMYRNDITMYSEIGHCGYKRVFSPPSDHRVLLDGEINNIPFKKEISEDDTFLNFLKEIFLDLSENKNRNWLEKTVNSFYDFEMLNSKINSMRKSNG